MKIHSSMKTTIDRREHGEIELEYGDVLVERFGGQEIETTIGDANAGLMVYGSRPLDYFGMESGPWSFRIDGHHYEVAEEVDA